MSGAFGEWAAWEPVGPEGEPVSPGRCALAVNYQECRPCLDHGVTPLTHTRATIDAAINELTNPVGTTNITQGLGWGWRVLVPDAPFTEAVAEPEGKRLQAIVLLTDGENFAGSGDGYKTVFGYGDDGRPEMDDRLRELSTAIKDAGIMEAVKALASQDKQRSMDANANIWNHGPAGQMSVEDIKGLGITDD